MRDFFLLNLFSEKGKHIGICPSQKLISLKFKLNGKTKTIAICLFFRQYFSPFSNISNKEKIFFKISNLIKKIYIFRTFLWQKCHGQSLKLSAGARRRPPLWAVLPSGIANLILTDSWVFLKNFHSKGSHQTKKAD